mgnify:CR=1 FL=1
MQQSMHLRCYKLPLTSMQSISSSSILHASMFSFTQIIPLSIHYLVVCSALHCLGKTYAKIYLWLCKQEDCEAFVDLESDPEGDNLPPAFSERRCDENAQVISDSDTENNVDAGNPNCEAASQPSSSLTIQAIVAQLQKKVN